MAREWNSEAYNRLSGPQLGFGKKVVERLAQRPLRGDELVLDAGCGTGRVTSELARLFPRGHIVAADLSGNMIRAARGTMARSFGDRVGFVCADLTQLPFGPVFDVAFSTATFHWITGHEGLFQSILGVLKPGGWLVAQCGGAGNLRTVRGRARRVQSDPRFAKYFCRWSEPWLYADAETTAVRLSDAGFTNVKTWLEDATVSLENRSEYAEFLETVTLHAQLERIAEPALRKAFIEELVAQAERAGRLILDYVRLNIEATKPRGTY